MWIELEKKQLDVDIRYDSLSAWDGIRCSVRLSDSAVCRVDGSEQLACTIWQHFEMVRDNGKFFECI
jgi:hypothetical protein